MFAIHLTPDAATKVAYDINGTRVETALAVDEGCVDVVAAGLTDGTRYDIENQGPYNVMYTPADAAPAGDGKLGHRAAADGGRAIVLVKPVSGGPVWFWLEGLTGHATLYVTETVT